jgi:primosomal protein N' (replication factor Y)
VILGSATPSLESLENAASGRYRRLRLSNRIGSSRLPDIKVLDIRRASLEGGLSAPLLEAIGGELAAANQVLLFLNRRGYAPTLQCHDCGYVAGCRHCDARLTLHRGAGELRCHHCEWRVPIPGQCPACHSAQLDARGVGTERTEATLLGRFPDYPVYRVDRDSMQRRRAMEELLSAVQTGDPCILLGTQMLTKGHHFPAVTLVGLLDTDASLFSADFRGPERMGQLLTQVSGRAGRADKPGRVLLQTHYPDHPLLNTLLASGYEEFAMALLEERRQAGLPPFGQLALVRAEAGEIERAERFLGALRRTLETERCTVHLVGPLPAPLPRKSGRFRCQLVMLATSRAVLKRAVTTLIAASDKLPDARRLRWSLDIDPVEAF